MNLLKIEGCLATSTKSANNELAIELRNLLDSIAKAEDAVLTTFEVDKGVVKVAFSKDVAATKATSALNTRPNVTITSLDPVNEFLEKTRKVQERADKMRDRWKQRQATK